MDTDRPVCFVMATLTLGCRQDDSIVVAQYSVDEKISGVVRVAAGAIARAIDCGAIAIGAGPEFTVFGQVVARAAAIVVEVGDQVATGVVAGLAGAVGGRAHLPRVVIGLEVIRIVVRWVAGDAGVGRDYPGPADDSMASGAANQGDGGDGAGMAGGAGVVVFCTVGIDQGHGDMAGCNAGGAAASDEQQAVIRDMGCHPVGMAVNAGKGDGVGCTGLDNGVGY